MSSTITATAPPGALLDVPVVSDKSGKIESGAKQFEALLIGQMLKSARESGSGSLGDDDDSSGETMLDVADQQFSQVLANNGGFGMARLLVQGLGGPAQAQAQAQSNENANP